MLDKLLFFNEKGFEIPVLKIYTLQWEIIPNVQISHCFIRNPKGHFMVDLNGKVTVHVDDPGLINQYSVELYNSKNNLTGVTVSNIKDIVLLDKIVSYEQYNKYNGTSSIFDETVQNTVLIAVNTLDKTYVEPAPITIFSNVTFSTENVIDADNVISATYHLVKSISLALDKNNKSFIDYMVESVFETPENIYPCVRYIGSCTQDKVSTDFVAASTVVILEELTDVLGNISYINPIYNTDISLLFEFQENSEMRFISSNTVADIIWENEYIANKTNQKNIDTPLYFSVGFTAQVEGCYQNIMGIYIQHNGKKYLTGLITFLTEVEGEDERYRALLGNLGIPDPIKYPNIFKSQEHLEECVDWILVNKKSKELMLNYENIFPYAGTYKALLNAVKFLGYFDLIFKEWYKIKDLNNNTKYVTLLTYDTVTGKSLKTKLKNIGVDFGEFTRYKKLNRLTMVYHLDLLDELNTFETLTEYDIDDKGKPTSKLVLFDIPQIQKIYEYRTDEILAKLYSVKVWLETHILGVNCYIADICGEGLVIERLKTLAYVTEHYAKDFYSEIYATPKITNITDFENSLSNITCTLSEYTKVTFETYADTPISDFIKYDNPKTYLTYTDFPVYISNPIGALIMADELQYELHTVDCSCGSLYEFMSDDTVDNPILIKDNQMVLYDNNKNTTWIDNSPGLSECPIIELSLANIRYTHGNWKTNIKYAINNIDEDAAQYIVQEFLLDPETNEKYPARIYEGVRQILLYPNSDNSKPLTSFIYSSNNQWNIPMIIIRNYTCSEFALLGDFILEIIRGRLIFRNKQTEIINGACSGAELLFGYEDLSFDDIALSIQVNYSYIDERFPVFTYSDTSAYIGMSNMNSTVNLLALPLYKSISSDASTRQQDLIYFNSLNNKNRYNTIKKLSYNSITEAVKINQDKNITVNRLGDYNLTVKAYDEYNRIYVNKSPKTYTVYALSVNIETYLNSPKIVNKKSFNDKTYFGELLNKADAGILLDNISENNINPIYPQTYRIYDIDPMLGMDNVIEYDNISYALDIPRTHDYITFNNFTERATSITLDMSKITIHLCDGNPNPDTLMYAAEIGLCIYDNIKKEIIYDIFPLTVVENGLHLCSDVIDTSTAYDSHESYILCENTVSIPDEYIDILFNNHINAYVYNSTSIILDTENIIVDYDNNKTVITNISNQYYKPDDVIKLSYLKLIEGPNTYAKCNTICNETTYKINDVVLSEEDRTYTYIIDGIFDLYKLNNKIVNSITTHNISEISYNTVSMKYDPIRIAISPAHLSAAQYTLRAMNNAEELLYRYNGVTIQRTQVEYEASPLLFDSYLDTNYSIVLQKFNTKVLDDMWCYNIHNYLNLNDNIYKYINVPVTIDKCRNIIIKYDETQTVLNKDLALNVLWDWSAYLVDNIPNSTISEKFIDKHLIFQSKNNILVLNPNILGPLNILLTLIDIYGNRVVNHGEGLLYVQDADRVPIKRPHYDKLDINPDVKSIIAITPFDTKANDEMMYGANRNTIDTIAADGESVTVYLNNSDVTLPKSGKLYSIDVPYAIYYNDGSVSYNKGAVLTLTDEDGNVIKGNKQKVKFGKSKHAHKHVCKKYKVNFLSRYNLKHDLVNTCSVTIPVMQYGFDKAIRIYGLLFLLHDIERSGVEQINSLYLSSMIYQVSYKMERTDGTIEDISGDTLSDVNLKIESYKVLTKSGNSETVLENTTGQRKYIGTLQITVLFYVNGVTDIIQTSHICPIYQE